MACAFYTEDWWYWFEDGNLLGGYATQVETHLERECVQGSDKYQRLTEGKLKPRLGDFVKDGISCGLVTHLDVSLNNRLGLIYRNSHEDCFADYESVTWIAPYEWSTWE